MAGRKGEYLFRRRGSGNWWVRFQIPPDIAEACDLKPRTERSLGTSDRALAEIRASDQIRQHKWLLFSVRAQTNGRFFSVGERKHHYEPGREHYTPEGQRVIATETELLFVADDGSITTRPNERVQNVSFRVPPEQWKELFGHVQANTDRSRFGRDEQLIESYIQHAGLKAHNAQEARSTFSIYKEVVGKPLARAGRDDGRKLARHLCEELGNKSATVEKKVGWLRAAVNMAIEDKRLTFNPFEKVVAKADDRMKKLPLSEDDMTLVRKNLSYLDEQDQLLWRLLATTGMRLGEAFQIKEEFAETHKKKRIRYFIVGTKSDSSERRIPLPTALSPDIPEKVQAPLFTGTSKAAGKRLMRFLRDVGISDPRKTTHCLRHRAKDRLRVLSCPIDVQYAILGHEKKTVAASYGEGYPCDILRKWVDQIG
jgi:integrase